MILRNWNSMFPSFYSYFITRYSISWFKKKIFTGYDGTSWIDLIIVNTSLIRLKNIRSMHELIVPWLAQLYILPTTIHFIWFLNCSFVGWNPWRKHVINLTPNVLLLIKLDLNLNSEIIIKLLKKWLGLQLLYSLSVPFHLSF